MLPAMRTIEFKLAHRIIATGNLIMSENREIVQLLFLFYSPGRTFDVLVVVHKALNGVRHKNPAASRNGLDSVQRALAPGEKQ
jgi:hypothetical protein